MTYYGMYRALCTSNADPTGQNRIQVMVPSVTQDARVWALPCLPAGTVSPVLPSAGDAVWVQYEEGNHEYPVWVGIF